jgi:hypothetical protein
MAQITSIKLGLIAICLATIPLSLAQTPRTGTSGSNKTASGVLHYDTFVQRIFSHSLTTFLFVFTLSCATSIQVSLVANITHDFNRSFPHQIQHQFRLKAPQLDVCLRGFFCRSNIITSFYRACDATSSITAATSFGLET